MAAHLRQKKRLSFQRPRLGDVQSLSHSPPPGVRSLLSPGDNDEAAACCCEASASLLLFKLARQSPAADTMVSPELLRTHGKQLGPLEDDVGRSAECHGHSDEFRLPLLISLRWALASLRTCAGRRGSAFNVHISTTFSHSRIHLLRLSIPPSLLPTTTQWCRPINSELMANA
ncbi:unnamed protein product [Symbiodinium natans]|uniref:Uncharacterized protein n=1 Tax=Symbiodinium natans TaxID=878477 RepID=A0A812UAN6_9DINO|nr:unnamed protein product [Symbiodinium natans]